MAQLVSASALGAEGPPFESEYPDKKELYESMTLFFVYDPSGLPGRTGNQAQMQLGASHTGGHFADLILCKVGGKPERVLSTKRGVFWGWEGMKKADLCGASLSDVSSRYLFDFDDCF